MVIGPHEPVFIELFVQTVPVSEVSAVEIGLSGWIVPAVVFDLPYTTGGAALGLTFTWGPPVGEPRGDASP